jgi:hypothetical protein
MSKIYTKIVMQWDDASASYKTIEEESFEYTGQLALCDRAAQSQAKQGEKTAEQNAATYGANAAGERSAVQQYDIGNLTNPQGMGQQGVRDLLTASLGGAGGSTSSLVGAEQLAAKRGTTGTNSAVLDDIARQRAKAGASASEGIAAQNVKAKLDQQQAAADDLSRRYGIDVNAQLGQGKLQNEDINTELQAGQSGWFQNLNQMLQTINGSANAAAGLKTAFK